MGLSLPGFAHEFGEAFEVGILLLPGGVDDAEDAGIRPGGADPVSDFFRAGVVVAGDELAVAAFREELQALVPLLEIPRDDDDILRQSLDRKSVV